MVDVEPNLSDIGHGAAALMARTRLMSPGSHAPTSTGLSIPRNIPLTSMCSHHHQTIGGVVHIGYIAGDKGQVIGLSKLNRIV